LLAAVYKSPGRDWIDADITELLSFKRKSTLGGDLKTKNSFWNTAITNPSGEKQLSLFDVHEFKLSAPQCPTHYFSAGNGDVLDTVVQLIGFQKQSGERLVKRHLKGGKQR
jgi:hypothetical protein